MVNKSYGGDDVHEAIQAETRGAEPRGDIPATQPTTSLYSILTWTLGGGFPPPSLSVAYHFPSVRLKSRPHLHTQKLVPFAGKESGGAAKRIWVNFRRNFALS